MWKFLATLFAFCALAGLAAPAPSPSNIITSQPTCTTTASVLVNAQPSQIHVFTIETAGTAAIYIGSAGVTTGTGFLIPATANVLYTLSFSGPVYCVAASGTVQTYVIETVQGGNP